LPYLFTISLADFKGEESHSGTQENKLVRADEFWEFAVAEIVYPSNEFLVVTLWGRPRATCKVLPTEFDPTPSAVRGPRLLSCESSSNSFSDEVMNTKN